MKKILLGLFVLSSLSFATSSNDDGNVVTATVPINVNAIVTNSNSLVLEITDPNGVVKNDLNFIHTLSPKDASKATENFKVALRENIVGTKPIFLTPTTNLEFKVVKNIKISTGTDTNSPFIETEFSDIQHIGENISLTNNIAKSTAADGYSIGNYTGTKVDGLTITFNKTTPSVPAK